MVLGTIDVKSTSKQRWYLVRLALDSLVAVAANDRFDNAFAHTHSYTVQRWMQGCGPLGRLLQSIGRKREVQKTWRNDADR